MEIINKKISELKPYKNNPRINNDAVDSVAKSIKDFGFKVPMIIDKNGVIIAGHTRYKAAKKLGLDEVPCIIADDLSEEQVNAFRLIDNKTAELSLWDWDLLDKELESLANFDLDLSLFDIGDDFNVLDDLENERIGEKVEKTQIGITFIFPKEKEDIIYKYIKKHTKEVLSNKIIEICEMENFND